MDLVIRGAEVLTPRGIERADVALDRGKVVRVGGVGETGAARVVDGTGKVILTGAIDPHVHVELLTVSGKVSSDDFESGSRAALMGGITTLGDFAYPEKGERLIHALCARREAAQGRCRTDFFLHVAVSENPPDLDAQMEECVAEGVRSFKVHMNDASVGRTLLDRICRFSAERDCVLMVHAEDGPSIAKAQARLVAEGKTALAQYPGSRPPECEAHAIDFVMSLAAKYRTQIYIVHLSSAAGLDAVRRHRKAGARIHAETCPQYLFLTEAKYAEPDGFCSTCCPPFRKDEDREALWGGLADGSIDTVATDHCPFMQGQKETWGGDYTRLPFGIPGVETMVPLLFGEGRKRGLSYEKLSALSAGNAAGIFGLPPRTGIEEGKRADFFVYDPGTSRTIDHAALHMRCDFSPYQGLRVTGWPVLTVFDEFMWPHD
ncbi:MAG: amidohydrolase family protein [Chlamydiota bacterium]